MNDKNKLMMCKNAIGIGQIASQFCVAMESRGEIVRKVIKDSGLSITKIAEKIHLSRNQLYLDFSNPEMSFDRILAIGRVLNYDFSQHFRELGTRHISLISEDESSYATTTQLLECQKKLISALELLSRYQTKYGTEL